MSGDTVYVIDASAGVRRALLVARLTAGHGRSRCKVRLQGAARPVTVDDCLVYATAEEARAAHVRAREHRRAMARLGVKLADDEALLLLSLTPEATP